MITPVTKEPLLGYHPCSIGFRTSRRAPAVGQCQTGSWTGAVASDRVSEAPKASLRMDGNHCLDNASGEIEVPVKMLVTCARTERPHGALLQLDTGIRYCMYRIGGRRRRGNASFLGVNVGIPPLQYWISNLPP